MNYKKKLFDYFIHPYEIKGKRGKVRLIKFRNIYFKKHLKEIEKDIESIKGNNSKEKIYKYIYNFVKKYIGHRGYITYLKANDKRKDMGVELNTKTDGMIYSKEENNWNKLILKKDKKIEIIPEENLETDIHKICLKPKEENGDTIKLTAEKSPYGMTKNKTKKISKELDISEKNVNRVFEIYKEQNIFDRLITKKPEITIKQNYKEYIDKNKLQKNKEKADNILKKLTKSIANIQKRIKKIFKSKRKESQTEYIQPLATYSNKKDISESMKANLLEDWKELGITVSEDIFCNNSKEYNSLPITSKNKNPSCSHLLIKSENYSGLSKLQEKYRNSIKCIYIDPPYNTKNAKSDYKDNYKECLWITMMRDRLRLAKELLTEDGCIFVSIDNNCDYLLRFIMNEIFEKKNFVSDFVWKRRSGTNQSKNMISKDHESVLCYTKNIEKFSFKGVKKDYENYSNPDNDPRGKWTKGDLTSPRTKEQEPDSYFKIKNPETGKEYTPRESRVWAYSKEKIEDFIQEDKIIFPENNNGIPYLKRFKSNLNKNYKPISSWIEKSKESDKPTKLTTDMNRSATKEIKNIFGKKEFSFTKPVKLIKNIIIQVVEENDIILDFTAGSGTTAQATIELNREQNKNLKYILIEREETNYKMIKKRIKKLMYSSKWKNGKPIEPSEKIKPTKCFKLETYESKMQNLDFKDNY